MSEPITITAEVPAYLNPYRMPHELMAALENGEAESAVAMLSYWSHANPPKDYTRVGDATITLRLMPQDEQVRMAVEALQRKLDEERAEWLKRQQAILAQISKLQALSYEPEAA